MHSEKEISFTDIPGNPNPVIEINEFMENRVLLYGHPGLCKTSEDLLSSDAFKLILHHYLAELSNQDSPLCPASWVSRKSTNSTARESRLSSGASWKKTQRKSPRQREPGRPQGFPRGALYLLEKKGKVRHLRPGGTTRKHRAEGLLPDIHPGQRAVQAPGLEHLPFDLRPRDGGLVQGLPPNPFRGGDGPPGGENRVELPPRGHYQKLKNIPFIRLSLIYPPLIYYTKSNKRKGKFNPLSKNPLDTIGMILPVGCVSRPRSGALSSSSISTRISFPTPRAFRTSSSWPAPRKSQPETGRHHAFRGGPFLDE